MNSKLKSVIAGTLGLDEWRVQPSLARDDEDSWDSLNHLRLITAVEEAFDVKLTMAEIESIATAAQLEACVDAHVQAE